jgi:hypothetical protein
MKKSSMITVLRIGAAVAVGVAAGVVGTSTAQASAGTTATGRTNSVSTPAGYGSSIPPVLQVPAGQRLVGVFEVEQGSQVYECTNGTYALLQPAAVLSSGWQLVLHTQGPEWISVQDGSAVTASAIAQVAVPNAVPELLLKATSNRGTGLFGKVDYIQRLDTIGGVAPTGQCTAGAVQAVPYLAQYRFYAPDSDS